jgi:sortase (surface protein transpeptidase)
MHSTPLSRIQKTALMMSLIFFVWWVWLFPFLQEHTDTFASTSTIDTTFPTRAIPNPTQDITDLSYRKDTLPYEQDKTAAWYVVYPKQWVAIPLVWPNSADLQKIKVGDLFNHYKYLEEGALHYVGNAPDQGIWNMVLAVHSSFAKADPGRYKTAGQVAPLSAVGDKVFLYLADERGEYTLYVYTIQQSEEIPETQVSILHQNVTQKTLTFFTCFPIGTTDARWVNKAVLTDTLTSEKRYVPTTSGPVFSTQSASNAVVLKNTPDEKDDTTTTKEHWSAPVLSQPMQKSTKNTATTKKTTKQIATKKSHKAYFQRACSV